MNLETHSMTAAWLVGHAFYTKLALQCIIFVMASAALYRSLKRGYSRERVELASFVGISTMKALFLWVCCGGLGLYLRYRNEDPRSVYVGLLCCLPAVAIPSVYLASASLTLLLRAIPKTRKIHLPIGRFRKVNQWLSLAGLLVGIILFVRCLLD